MPNCKKCGSRLSRFDKDICPVCGEKHPFDGVNQETVDITQEIDSIPVEEIAFERKERKTVILLSLFLGWCGAPYIYLRYYRRAIIYAVSLLLLHVACFCVMFFACNLTWYVSLFLPCVIYLIGDITIACLLSRHDMKDARGEYLN